MGSLCPSPCSCCCLLTFMLLWCCLFKFLLLLPCHLQGLLHFEFVPCTMLNVLNLALKAIYAIMEPYNLGAALVVELLVDMPAWCLMYR